MLALKRLLDVAASQKAIYGATGSVSKQVGREGSGRGQFLSWFMPLNQRNNNKLSTNTPLLFVIYGTALLINLCLFLPCSPLPQSLPLLLLLLRLLPCFSPPSLHAELPSSPGGQFTFRPLPPPPPPPHACTCARPAPYTQVSLQRKTMPTRCQASQGGQGADNGSSTDQAQLHNSWVLNSNIPLETRWENATSSSY